MNRKKAIFGTLVVLIVVLVMIIIWGFNKMNYVTEQVVTDIRQDFIQLEDRISSQREDQWSEPGLVTTKVEELMNGIGLAWNIGSSLNTFSQSEEEFFYHLNGSLQQFDYRTESEPLGVYSDLSSEDQKNYEELGEILREVGFEKSNLGENATKDTVMRQLEELVEQLNNRTE
ncbi:hypothetical protein [Aquisalibacillus elongatus]|uniref:Uncharacterized protein n=1 Tax=Aquisalibacillus elongatus TaxID=485577 RepID=A0A3N5BEJ8_9BACI|nr:hypothetical protein [Aquisalibacillus elongatus]RPF56136.1 hypothetical protein EDC24_1025 [Aquisalibacillus elongatus]